MSGAVQMRMKRSRTVLCLGKSQVGKSRTCNLLCGRDGLFEEGNKISSCTMQPARETVQFEQGDTTIELTVIDMPGLFDTRSAQDNDKLMERIRDFIKYEMHSLDRVFYVVKLGAITPEEVKCLELVRAMFSDAVVSSGLFSVLLTHCDSMSEAERANLVKEVGVSSGLKPHLPLFDNGSGPQILAVDFSKNSKSVEADVRKVLTSILQANRGMHKTRAFRFYATMQEAEELSKMRAALVQNIKQEFKTVDAQGKTVCPIQ